MVSASPQNHKTINIFYECLNFMEMDELEVTDEWSLISHR